MSKLIDFFKGKTEAAFKYGGIKSSKRYLEERFGGDVRAVETRKLKTKAFSQGELEASANNCSLAAITRVLMFYRSIGFRRIPESLTEVYDNVKAIASQFGYTKKKGTGFTKISEIAREALINYGYDKPVCKNIYFIWWFRWPLKRELDAGRPVVLNIARGHFYNHTVTVCGYENYEIVREGKKIKRTMLYVNNGWNEGVEYMDYNAFAYDFLHSGIGSYTIIRPKK